MLYLTDEHCWVFQVTDLPREMASGEWRGRARPIKQFVMNWNDHPDQREAMLNGAPVGEHPFDLAAIAATVAGLCERDGVPEPHWVNQHRWEGEPRLVIDYEVGCEWSRMVKARAPAVCDRFNVYYSPSWLDAATYTRFPPEFADALAGIPPAGNTATNPRQQPLVSATTRGG